MIAPSNKWVRFPSVYELPLPGNVEVYTAPGRLGTRSVCGVSVIRNRIPFKTQLERQVAFCAKYRAIIAFSANNPARLLSTIAKWVHFHVRSLFFAGHFVIVAIVFM
jgi:hypothetical protein